MQCEYMHDHEENERQWQATTCSAKKRFSVMSEM
jgi:hypothetical protein